MDYNHEEPLIMHVDLNSAFASIEQQARPMLRGRPVAVLNRRVENTTIVTASYEAKALGAKVGMKFSEAARLVPGLIGIESDPPKYRYVYHKLMAILKDYSPNAVMKSIDEGAIDFRHLAAKRSLIEIGYEIKRRLHDEVGCAMRCNVGIGTSQWLAKQAAGLHKPDGLDLVSADNLRSTYAGMKLTDLTGIACHMERRLNAVGIFTPLEFLDSDEATLRKLVFKGVLGERWFKRLRGFEVDCTASDTKTVGRQYVLEDRGLTTDEIRARLHNLCESVGFRLRSQRKVARGLQIHVRTHNHIYWHRCQMCQMPFYSDGTINCIAQRLFAEAPGGIIEVGVSCYALSDNYDLQASLFQDEVVREEQLSCSVDEINQRFGERTIFAADTLKTNQLVKSKIPFGSTRYL